MAQQDSVEAKRQRRSERLFLTIPVRVFATDPNGRDFSEDALTVVVGHYGGRIRVESSLVVDDEIHITNLSNNKEAKFRVVGRVSKPQPGNPFSDWGVECLEPEKGIWGVQFRDSPPDATVAAALLECCVCSLVSSVQLTDEEVDTLSVTGIVSRPCASCRQATLWKYASTDRRKQEAPPPVEAPAAAAVGPEPRAPDPMRPAALAQIPERRSGEDRRREHRLVLRVPVRVRTPDGRIEVTKTENYSKTGAAFLSEKNYPVETMLFVAIPYTIGEEPMETRAVVEEIQDLPGSPTKLYGIRFESRPSYR